MHIQEGVANDESHTILVDASLFCEGKYLYYDMTTLFGTVGPEAYQAL